eukprot:6471544-Amphidinium_carterae.1
MRFNTLKSDAFIFCNVKTNVYLMAYVDDLLVVGNPSTMKTFLEQFKVRLELKHASQLTVETHLEFLGKSTELQQDGTIQLSFSPQCYSKLLKTIHTREQHSQHRTAVGHLLLVSQLRRSLQMKRHFTDAEEEASNDANAEDNFVGSPCNHHAWMEAMNETNGRATKGSTQSVA